MAASTSHLSVGNCSPNTTCPVDNGFLSAPPSLAGAAIFLAAFAALVPLNIWEGVRWKTMTYSLTLVLGLLLEVMGYVGRLLLRSNLASTAYFLVFLLGTTVGPIFITMAVYSVLPHLLALYGDDVSIVPRPVWLNYFFAGLGSFTLFFHLLGSAFAAEGYNRLEMQQGVNVLVAGLGLQAASILLYYGAYVWFLSRLSSNREFLDPRFSDIFLSTKFKTSMLCMQLALALILIRTIARMVQLASGLSSSLSQSQAYIPVLDGGLTLVAVLILTLAGAPGPAFGRAWLATSPCRRGANISLSAAPYPTHHRVPGSPLQDLYGSPAPSPLGYQIRPQQQQRNRHNSWTGHKRQHSATSSSGTVVAGPPPPPPPPPYERPASGYTRVPFVPPRALSLRQQYGQGRVVESEVEAPGTEGSRTGGSGGGPSGGTGSGGRTRTRSSPRVFDEDMVRHDSIW